ncbi:MAG TPA: hypothetical protein VGA80_04555 [Flavobacteriaceae bacterium]
MAINEEELLHEIKKPTTAKDLEELLPGINIIMYDDIKKYKSIYHLIGINKRVIIFYRWATTSGHWTLLFQRPDCSIEFFCSYGMMPDEQSKYINDDFWDKGYLTDMLYKLSQEGVDIHFNKFPFQTVEIPLGTCGQWCILRYLLGFFTIDDFVKFFETFNYIDKNVICLALLKIWKS